MNNVSAGQRASYVEVLSDCNRRRESIQGEISRYQLLLEQSTATRAELMAQCREKFGTEDMDELRKIAQRMKEEDVASVTTYMTSINEVSDALAQIKRAMEG